MKQAYIPKKRNTGKRKRKSIILLSKFKKVEFFKLKYVMFRLSAVFCTYIGQNMRTLNG